MAKQANEILNGLVNVPEHMWADYLKREFSMAVAIVKKGDPGYIPLALPREVYAETR